MVKHCHARHVLCHMMEKGEHNTVGQVEALQQT